MVIRTSTATFRSSLMLGGGRLATGVVDVSDDLGCLDGSGFWAVAVTFDGTARCVRFSDVRPASAAAALPRGNWRGPSAGSWTSSLSAAAYRDGVRAIRSAIADGEVYQVNLCRILTAGLDGDAGRYDVLALGTALAHGNPAPYGMVLDVPEAGLRVASASPELFLSREGDVVESGPIKGTARTAADLLDKDRAENVMIVDLVRNDLGRIAVPGSVDVPALCRVESHPGLVHLVSRVRARLRAGVGWPEIFAATFPPGSVSGAPKSSALRMISRLEPVDRGLYCGALGWVDADRGTAELAVGIRTFQITGDELRFGTGAGITWGSDPVTEWTETELKAARLLGLASARTRSAVGTAPQ